jgi:hypothetical protein
MGRDSSERGHHDPRSEIASKRRTVMAKTAVSSADDLQKLLGVVGVLVMAGLLPGHLKSKIAVASAAVTVLRGVGRRGVSIKRP